MPGTCSDRGNPDALAYYEDHPKEIEAEFEEEQRYVEVEIPRLQAMVAERRKQYG